MQWHWRDAPGALAALAISVGSLLVVVNPTHMLRTGLALLTPLVVLLAFLSSLQQGGCSACHAARRHQRRVQNEPVVRAASRAGVYGSDFGVLTGWEVDIPVQFSCSRCGHTRKVVSTSFYDHATAATGMQAAILARAEPA